MENALGVTTERNIMITDGLKTYSTVWGRLSLNRRVVRRDQHHVPAVRIFNNNAIEGTWPGLRQFLRRRRNVPIKEALDEYVWRRKYANDLLGGFLSSLKSIKWN